MMYPRRPQCANLKYYKKFAVLLVLKTTRVYLPLAVNPVQPLLLTAVL
jgi:hypothetical protein